jgi:hypothetical protein
LRFGKDWCQTDFFDLGFGNSSLYLFFLSSLYYLRFFFIKSYLSLLVFLWVWPSSQSNSSKSHKIDTNTHTDITLFIGLCTNVKYYVTQLVQIDCTTVHTSSLYRCKLCGLTWALFCQPITEKLQFTCFALLCFEFQDPGFTDPPILKILISTEFQSGSIRKKVPKQVFTIALCDSHNVRTS